jgi:hypothetical protein
LKSVPAIPFSLVRCARPRRLGAVQQTSVIFVFLQHVHRKKKELNSKFEFGKTEGEKLENIKNRTSDPQ